MQVDLKTRSIRTWAWLGDVEFERLVRWRVAALADHPVDRLDRIKAQVVRAEAQAELLVRIDADLNETERAVVRRARNSRVNPSTQRGRQTRDYRAATALEALVGYWVGAELGPRLEELLGPPLDLAIDDAERRVGHKPRRG